MLLGAAPDADTCGLRQGADAAAKAVGVNFIGGYGALVHKGFSAGRQAPDREHPPRAGRDRLVCSSINVGSTKSGINMDAWP